MTPNPFSLLSSEVKYQNPWITLREDRVIRPWGKEGIFGIVTMKNGSTILALDENNDAYITNDYHYAAGCVGTEIVSGWMDENETPLDCAKRELAEEAWLLAEEWTDLGYVDPFTTVISSRNHMFLARNLRKIPPNPDEGEIVNVSKIPFSELLRKAMESEISHGASVVAILKTHAILESEK